MPNKRDKNKKLVGFWATAAEKKALEKLAKKKGLTVAELLRSILKGELVLALSSLLGFLIFLR